MLDGPRAAFASELPAVIGLSNRVFYPDGRFRMEQVLPALFRDANAGNLRIMVDAGSVVAMAGMVVSDLCLDKARLRAACIGSVCTLPEYRGQGLAAALMEDALSHAVSRGASLALISGGRGLYRRMGCIDAGLFTVIEVDRGLHCDADVRARPWTEQDHPALWDLHEKEPVRFVRGQEEMAVLLGSRAMFCRPCRTWVVEHEARPLAYLCVSGPDDLTGAGVLLVREMAGDRRAALGAARVVLETEGAERMQIEVPATDELSSLAASRGLARSTAGMHGTLKIIDRAAFLQSLDPRLPPSISALPDAVEELAAAVFGSVERAAASPTSAPLLPLPGYGMNYV